MATESTTAETAIRNWRSEGASVNDGGTSRSRTLALFALALGTFCIGTTEFASMGIIQLFSASLGIDIPTATHAVTASGPPRQ